MKIAIIGNGNIPNFIDLMAKLHIAGIDVFKSAEENQVTNEAHKVFEVKTEDASVIDMRYFPVEEKGILQKAKWARRSFKRKRK